jgi:fatty acid desaturase
MIPHRLNLVLCLLLIPALSALLLFAAYRDWGWGLLPLALAYAWFGHLAYALLHEAEHGVLMPSRRLNNALGVLLGIFFPAPFHLLRQSHLHHHRANRGEGECFDLIQKGENPWWKRMMFYGILCGTFWLTTALFGNLIAALAPGLLRSRHLHFDRAAQALGENLDPAADLPIRLEAWAIFAIYAALICLTPHPAQALLLLASFGVSWSSLQYVHHFGSPRDTQRGAWNLHLPFPWLDRLMLNHNLHYRHHQRPELPWTELPHHPMPGEPASIPFFLAWLRQWRGPRPEKPS